MAWLAKLDARAARWPTPARWTYLGVKWYLVGLGGLALFGSWAMKVSEIKGWF
jgi:hypothetical protein